MDVTSPTLNQASIDVHQYYNETLHVIVRCTNGAGQTVSSVTDGVKLLKEPPRTDHVVLDVLTLSTTQYSPRGIYQGDASTVRFRWKDFNMYQNISSYTVI